MIDAQLAPPPVAASRGSAPAGGSGGEDAPDAAVESDPTSFGAALDRRPAPRSSDTPIATAQFSSDWELSVVRAAAVARTIQSAGVPETRLQAAGYGETKPDGDDATVVGRATNRATSSSPGCRARPAVSSPAPRGARTSRRGSSSVSTSRPT